MKILGRHLVIELSNCDKNKLNNLEYLEKCLDKSVQLSGATKVKSVFHRYNPQGVSGVVVIAESHCSIHTWPEYGYAAIDYFTCGELVDPYRGLDYLKEALQAENVQVTELKRGIPSEKDEIISHKPAAISLHKAI